MRKNSFARTSDGLRDALMSEMEDIRAGIASAAEATAFALLAKQVIGSMEADIAMQSRTDALEDRMYRRKREEEETAYRRRQEERERLIEERSDHLNLFLESLNETR